MIDTSMLDSKISYIPRDVSYSYELPKELLEKLPFCYDIHNAVLIWKEDGTLKGFQDLADYSVFFFPTKFDDHRWMLEIAGDSFCWGESAIEKSKKAHKVGEVLHIRVKSEKELTRFPCSRCLSSYSGTNTSILADISAHLLPCSLPIGQYKPATVYGKTNGKELWTAFVDYAKTGDKTIYELLMERTFKYGRGTSKDYFTMSTLKEVEKKMKYICKCIPEIKNVVIAPPYTTVIWWDDTKTQVKCMETDNFDPEHGFAMAVLKKIYEEAERPNAYSKWVKKWVKAGLENGEKQKKKKKAPKETKTIPWEAD